MTRTIVYCDKCKKPVARGSGTEMTAKTWGGAPQNRRESIDLCSACTSALSEWLNASALSAPPLRAMTRAVTEARGAKNEGAASCG